MKHILPKDISIQQVFGLLTSGINPRPIALVATTSKEGVNNLSPFSFFNAFGANPPMIGFSPSCRVRDGSRKHTYFNLKETEQCTVQVVTHDIVEQVNLASTEYEEGVDEFVKSGLTPIPSDLVNPPRVKESPFQMECKLDQIIHLGAGKGSGNLMLCEVLKFHLDDSIFEDGKINPYLMDLVGRNGGDYYTRANGDAVFSLKKPLQVKGIGYDQLPEHIRLSKVFTGNDLARFGNSESIPPQLEAENLEKSILASFKLDPEIDPIKLFERAEKNNNFETMLAISLSLKSTHLDTGMMIEKSAKTALEAGNKEFAWKAALLARSQ